MSSFLHCERTVLNTGKLNKPALPRRGLMPTMVLSPPNKHQGSFHCGILLQHTPAVHSCSMLLQHASGLRIGTIQPLLRTEHAVNRHGLKRGRSDASCFLSLFGCFGRLTIRGLSPVQKSRTLPTASPCSQPMHRISKIPRSPPKYIWPPRYRRNGTHFGQSAVAMRPVSRMSRCHRLSAPPSSASPSAS